MEQFDQAFIERLRKATPEARAKYAEFLGKQFPAPDVGAIMQHGAQGGAAGGVVQQAQVQQGAQVGGAQAPGLGATGPVGAGAVGGAAGGAAQQASPQLDLGQLLQTLGQYTTPQEIPSAPAARSVGNASPASTNVAQALLAQSPQRTDPSQILAQLLGGL